jgi:transcriptional regulator with XRE-family HTH domain
MDSLDGPIGTIAKRVREVRGRRGWTAAQLGEELHKHGVPWDRFTVSSLESGKRKTVTVQELIGLALALDVAPIHLLVPLDDRPYLLAGSRIENANDVRDWFRGRRPLGGVDERTYLSEVSVRELWEQRVGAEPKNLAELAEALRQLPDDLAQKLNSHWFKSHGAELNRQTSAWLDAEDEKGEQ